jgi:hypothetical protein
VLRTCSIRWAAASRCGTDVGGSISPYAVTRSSVQRCLVRACLKNQPAAPEERQARSHQRGVEAQASRDGEEAENLRKGAADAIAAAASHADDQLPREPSCAA